MTFPRLEERIATIPAIVVVEDEDVLRRVYDGVRQSVRYSNQLPAIQSFSHADDFFEWMTAQERPEANAYFFDNFLPDPARKGSEKSYFVQLAAATYKRGVPLDQISLVSGHPPTAVSKEITQLLKPFSITDLAALMQNKVSLVGNRINQ